MDLTDRQTRILKAVVEEYIDTADPVASELLEKKYSLGVSPATIRNELVALTKMGFLKQPHTSAGRIPSSMGLKFYINNLMQHKGLSVMDEVTAKEKVWDARNNMDKLMRQTVAVLAQKTHTLAVVATEEGNIYYSGTANILESPEFYDIQVTRHVLELLDHYNRLHELFFKRTYGQDRVHIVMGEDLGWQYMDPVGFVFSFFKTRSGGGTVGVIGPCRLNYPYIIPTVEYFGDLLTEAGGTWS